MFNGEVEHPESPPREDAKEENEETTPSKVITVQEDSKPAADEPSDPQVQRTTCHIKLLNIRQVAHRVYAY